MEPIAVGFMILVGTAALIGAVVGAVGGAVTWRVGTNLALGGLLTAVGLLLVLMAEGGGSLRWLRPRLTWGVPSMAFTFLAASVSARWLQTRTTLSRNATAAAAFAVALSLGLLSLRLFGLSLRAPVFAAVGAGACLILLTIQDRSRRSYATRAGAAIFLAVGLGALTVALLYDPATLVPEPPYGEWIFVRLMLLGSLAALGMILLLGVLDDSTDLDDTDPLGDRATFWRVVGLAYLISVLASATFLGASTLVDWLDRAVG